MPGQHPLVCSVSRASLHGRGWRSPDSPLVEGVHGRSDMFRAMVGAAEPREDQSDDDAIGTHERVSANRFPQHSGSQRSAVSKALARPRSGCTPRNGAE